MLIYEKENKLNINFDNEVSEQPDLQISKEDGKTSVKIDGQESGGGSGGGVMHVNATSGTSDKTLGELLMAYDAGTTIIVSYVSSNGFTCKGTVIGAAGVYVDSKGNYGGNVVVAKGIREDNNLTPFSMVIEPTVSEADALATYPTLVGA